MIKTLKIIKNKILNFIKFEKFYFTLNLNKQVSGISILEEAKGFLFFFTKNNYLRFILSPKYQKNFKLISTETSNKTEFGILIQGPILNNEEKKFLYNTLQIYKKIFPNTSIVLSTWESSNTAEFENDFKNLTILKNEIPKNPGLVNINFQIKSASEGLKKIKEMGIKNVLKTRTDTRVMKPNTVSYLLSMLDKFKISNQKFNRIFSCNLQSTKFRPYGLSDLVMFGETKDIELYFNSEDEDTFFKKNQLDKIINDTALAGEVFLCSRYLINIGETLDWSQKHWWKCLAKYFGIFNCYDIDMFWKKYDWQFEQRGLRNYSNLSHRCFDFSDWISLYSNKELNLSDIGYKEKHIEMNGKILKDKFF